MKKVILMGAAGRDFHNFNICFQDNERSQVTALTAKQIPEIEEGSTLSRGGMLHGAAIIAATKYSPSKTIDPRSFAFGSLAKTFQKFTFSDIFLPTMDHGNGQSDELAPATLKIDGDLIIRTTPINLRQAIKIDKKILPAQQELEEIGSPNSARALGDF